MGYVGHTIRHSTLQHSLLGGQIEGRRSRGRPRNNVDGEYSRVVRISIGAWLTTVTTGCNSFYPIRHWMYPDDDETLTIFTTRCRDKMYPAVKNYPPHVTLPSVLSAVCIAQNCSDGNSQVSASTKWLALAEPTCNCQLYHERPCGH